MRPLTIALLCALAAVGCSQDEPTPATSAPRDGSLSAAALQVGVDEPDPALSGGGPVMAVVNGTPLSMAPLHEMLIRQHGLELARQLVANELVRQEAARLQIELTEQDVAAEQELQLELVFPSVEKAEERRAMLGQFLERTGLTPAQWRLAIRRNALLGKIAEKRVNVTDAMIEQAFASRYEKKVVVRHIQVASFEAASLLRKHLLSGAEFEALARQSSMGPTARDGGLLPPFGARDEAMHPVLRDAALAMKQPGQISDILQIGKSFHLLKMERIIEAENVRLEDVREQMAALVRRQQVQQLKQTILEQLFLEARKDDRIRFVDPTLRELNDKQLNAARGDTDPNPRK